MSTVTSRFTTRKLQSMEPTQASIEYENLFEIGRKNVYCISELTHHGTNNASIKKKYLKIKVAKQNMLCLYKVRSKTNPLKKKSSKDMRLLPKL